MTENNIRGTYYNPKISCRICSSGQEILLTMFDPEKDIEWHVCEVCAKIIHSLYHNKWNS